MAIRRRSTKAASGASMRRWFRVREGEIEAGVGAMDSGVLSLRFYKAVGRRKTSGQGEGGRGGGTSMALIT
jgi:hypothetical protein